VKKRDHNKSNEYQIILSLLLLGPNAYKYQEASSSFPTLLRQGSSCSRGCRRMSVVNMMITTINQSINQSINQ